MFPAAMASPRDPTISRAVIAVCVALSAVFVADAVTDFDIARLLALWPVVLRASVGSLLDDPTNGPAWLGLATVFTSTLVHADVMHLGFNLAYFWLFGTLLSQVAGGRWVVITLAWASLTAGLAFVVLEAGSAASYVIGASGAITGVSGLYVLLAFRWEIPWAMAFPLARPVPPLHAALIGIAAVGMDLYALRSGVSDGVAYASHVGGFAGGLLLGALLTTFYPTWDRFRASWWGRGAHGP